MSQRLDRLAVTNMTSKGRGSNSMPINTDHMNNYAQTNEWNQNYNDQHRAFFEHDNNRGVASLDKFSQPLGEMTSKGKLNQGVNTYQMERQSKNGVQYGHFVSALNSNIVEDQQRTNQNNDRYKVEQKPGVHYDRIYHPTLVSSNPTDSQFSSIEYERNGQGTRDRNENSLAKNKNSMQSGHSNEINMDLPLPQAKLNYGMIPNQGGPMEMDLTSHLEMQFQGLINGDMQKQIQSLQSKSTSSTDGNIHGQTPLDRQSVFLSQSGGGYNPHADYMNNQMQQMSRQMPENRNSLSNQFQNMHNLNNLNNLPAAPSIDPMGLRPSSSNHKAINMGPLAPIGYNNQGNCPGGQCPAPNRNPFQ